MKKTKEIASEIVGAGDGREAALAAALETLHSDILAGLPEGIQAVGIRAAVRLHEERAKALDHRLGGEHFLPQVQAWLAARVLEITGSDKAAASVLAAPVGKVRRADAVGTAAKTAGREDEKRQHARHGKRDRGERAGSKRNGHGRTDGEGAGDGAGAERAARPRKPHGAWHRAANAAPAAVVQVRPSRKPAAV